MKDLFRQVVVKFGKEGFGIRWHKYGWLTRTGSDLDLAICPIQPTALPRWSADVRDFGVWVYFPSPQVSFYQVSFANFKVADVTATDFRDKNDEPQAHKGEIPGGPLVHFLKSANDQVEPPYAGVKRLLASRFVVVAHREVKGKRPAR